MAPRSQSAQEEVRQDTIDDVNWYILTLARMSRHCMPQASDGGQASSEAAHQVCGDSEKYKVVQSLCVL